MTSHSSVRRGVLVALRHRIRRAWPVSALVVALFALPAIQAESAITQTGQVSPAVGPGDTTTTSSLRVGADGTGTLTVDGGSVLTIGGGSGLFIGGEAPTTGHGTVFVDGPGSKINVTGRAVSVGRWGTPSIGELYITNGGAVSALHFFVGVSDFAGANGSTGTVIVDGSGSAVTLSGISTSGNAAAGVIGGDQGSGTATLRNGATMSISAPGSTLVGPDLTIGRAGATGAFNIESGASLAMDGTGATARALITVGNRGTGALTVTDASLSITANPFGGGIRIGTNTETVGTGNGIGTVTFENNASVLITGSSGGSGFTLGQSAGSEGTLNVNSGAALTINATTGGGGFTIADAGTGTMTVSGIGTTVLQDSLTATASWSARRRAASERSRSRTAPSGRPGPGRQPRRHRHAHGVEWRNRPGDGDQLRRGRHDQRQRRDDHR